MSKQNVERATVLEMANAGTRPKEIAKKLNCNPSTVYDHLSKARRQGLDVPGFAKGKAPAKEVEPKPRAQQIVVSVRLFNLLEREAERTGKTPTETANRILENGLLGMVGRNV